MRQFFPFIVTAAVLASASISRGVLTTTGAGSSVPVATHTATFGSIATYTDLTNYLEDGLKVQTPNSAYLFSGSTQGTSSFTGGFYYGNGGQFAFTMISTIPEEMIYGLEFTIGTGWFNLSDNLYWQTKVDGAITGSGLLTPTMGSVVGFTDGSGFETLELGLYSNLAAAQAVNNAGTNFRNALALDDLRLTTARPLTPPPIPEPSTALFGLALAGAVGLGRRRAGRV